MAATGINKLVASLALRGSHEGCQDIKAKKVARHSEIGAHAKTQLKEMTKEDGSETELRICEIEGESRVVVAKMKTTAKGDSFTTHVEGRIFSLRDGSGNDQLIDSFSRTLSLNVK